MRFKWIRTQFAWFWPFGAGAPGRRMVIRLATEFLDRENCSYASFHEAFPVRNEGVFASYAGRLGQDAPVGTLWEVFFDPDANSRNVGEFSQRIIVLVDDETRNCAFQERH